MACHLSLSLTKEIYYLSSTLNKFDDFFLIICQHISYCIQKIYMEICCWPRGCQIYYMSCHVHTYVVDEIYVNFRNNLHRFCQQHKNIMYVHGMTYSKFDIPLVNDISHVNIEFLNTIGYVLAYYEKEIIKFLYSIGKVIDFFGQWQWQVACH